KVTSPPRSTSKTGRSRASRTWPARALRPSVTTGGCWSSRITSRPSRPSIRASASDRCHSSASWYGTRPASITSIVRSVTPRPSTHRPGSLRRTTRAPRRTPARRGRSRAGLSHVHHSPQGIERRLSHGLGHRRVCVNRQLDLFHRVLVLPRHRQLVDDLGGVPAHDVGAQDLTVFLVAQDLHEPLGLARSPGPAVGREREPAGHVLEVSLLALVFGEPDAGHFGMAVRHAGYVIVFDRVWLLPRDELGDS